MSINQGPGNELFAVWFTYDAQGRPMWYTLQAGRWETNTVYSGPIFRTSGAPFSRPNATADLQVEAVGKGALVFPEASKGTFVFTVDGVTTSRALQRQPIE
jgi:hypothetical protein